MTNKLPEVGKRYKQKRYDDKERTITVESITQRVNFRSKVFDYCVDLDDFWLEFEEIPDHIPESRKKVEDNRFTDVGKTIKEAKEELKNYIWNSTSLILDTDDLLERTKQLINVRNSAQNLLNALDAQEEPRKISRIRNLYHDNFSPELIGALETLEENQEILDEKIEKLLGGK
jgi:hypothetical protein